VQAAGRNEWVQVVINVEVEGYFGHRCFVFVLRFDGGKVFEEMIKLEMGTTRTTESDKSKERRCE